MNTASLLQFLFSGLKVAAIYRLVTFGRNIVLNATDAVNFAHGELSIFGAVLGRPTSDCSRPRLASLPPALESARQDPRTGGMH